MADVRFTPGLPVARGAPAAPARTEAVKAAQRAFFNAALNQADAAAPVRRTAASASAAASGAGRAAEPAPGDGRIRRPGSFLDIKV